MSISIQLRSERIFWQLVERAKKLVDYVDGIHLTDSVLGIPRVSSITAANFIIRNIPNHPALKLERQDKG